jgi:hypothetical protein
MGNILAALAIFFFSSITFADTCTDDYIISGGRAIDLLPDNPFKILENGTELIVARGTLILKFTNLKIIEKDQLYIKRYSLIFINDEYYFDLIKMNDENQWGWEQYETGKAKRGFGGICKNDKNKN